MDPQETVAWERKWRTPAFATALAAALLPIASLVPLSQVHAKNGDNDLILLQRFDAHSSALIVSSAIASVALLALSFTLYYLSQGARMRRPTPMAGVLTKFALAGPIIAAVATMIATLLEISGARQFVRSAAQLTPQQLQQLGSDACSKPLKAGCALKAQIDPATNFIQHNTDFQIAGYLGPTGLLLVALAIVLVCLTAMRVGLLTRVIAIIGIAAGVLTIVPIIQQPAPLFLEFIWLLALAAIFARRWPNGVPPAWETGEDTPWPTRQQMADQREREKGGPTPTRGRGAQRDPEPNSEDGAEEVAAVAAASSASGHPSSKKRKRKRRRR